MADEELRAGLLQDRRQSAREDDERPPKLPAFVPAGLGAAVFLLALVVALLSVQLAVGPLHAKGSNSTNSGSPTQWDSYDSYVNFLEGIGYTKWDSFMPIYWNKASGSVVLEVPNKRLGHLVICNAEISEADGNTRLLHQPVGQAYWLLLAAADTVSVDVITPPLDFMRLGSNSTMTEALAEGGVAPVWSVTIPPSQAGYSGGSSSPQARCFQKYDSNGDADTACFYDAYNFIVRGLVNIDAAATLNAAKIDSTRITDIDAYQRNIELNLELKADGASLGIHLSITAAPAEVMEARIADDRVGFFSDCFELVGSDATKGPNLRGKDQDRRTCLAHRWRLEPRGGLPCPDDGCVPVKPITYHLDPSIPVKWRRCFKHGVEAWNRGFVAAGWVDGTIRAIMPGDRDWPADYQASDVRYSSITWAPSLKQVYSVGPSVIDPRSGEILDADIMFSESWVGAYLNEWHLLTGGEQNTGGDGGNGNGNGNGNGDDAFVGEHDDHAGHDHAGHGHGAAPAADFASVHRGPRPSSQCFHHHGPAEFGGSGGSALLAAAAAVDGAAGAREVFAAATRRRLLGEGVWAGSSSSPGDKKRPDGNTDDPSDDIADLSKHIPPVTTDDFVCEALAEITMHEVGHTLGLRHNFAGSSTVAWEDILDPSWVREHGITGSIMDYIPPLLPANRSLQQYAFSPTIGEYDVWAIRFGYTAAAGVTVEPTDGSDGVPGVVLTQKTLTQPPAVQRVLDQAGEPRFAFCTDDADSTMYGRDALCSTYDHTSDPIAYFRDRNELARQAKQAIIDRITVPEEGDWGDAYPVLHVFLHTGSISSAVGAAFAAKHVGGHVATAARYYQVEAPYRLVPAEQQRRALDLIAETLTSDLLYVAPENLTQFTIHGSTFRGKRFNDEDALGRLPAPVVEDARAAKRMVLESLLSPARGLGMVRSAQALGAVGQDAVTVSEVVSRLSRELYGEEFWALAPLVLFSSSAQYCEKGGGNNNGNNGNGDGGAGEAAQQAIWELAGRALEAMKRQGGELRSLQMDWTDSLLKLAEPPAASSVAAALDAAAAQMQQPAVQPPTELVAATTAALAETRAGVRCVLSRQLVELQQRAVEALARDAQGAGGAAGGAGARRGAGLLAVVDSEVELRHHLEALLTRLADW